MKRDQAGDAGTAPANPGPPAACDSHAYLQCVPAYAAVTGDGACGPVATSSESRQRMYEAYNELHNLAKVFSKPFDAPAILVVGHQTDGKSALMEALMGFQFNHVGGGTKTRRPVTLHMKYHAASREPSCYLVDSSGADQEMSLEELQEYIEAENQKLQAENQFSNKDITIRIEYKYCPNLTIVDTPGLISAAPGKKNSALQVASRQVEAMVKQKMLTPEYIILCLEDSSDWSNATTRRLVMSVDPLLSRTVVVSTKFDTRLPQFATADDAEAYMHPDSAQLMHASMLSGAPFFTSVPSGRVGNAKDSVFHTNDDFRDAVARQEAQDRRHLEAKLRRSLTPEEISRFGVTHQRSFLEDLLQHKYLASVPAIIPVLEQEFRTTDRQLRSVVKELSGLNNASLKERGRVFIEAFIGRLTLLLRGTTTAPAGKFGETLSEERVRGGTFSSETASISACSKLSNAELKLYGGAQYNRAMLEFRTIVGATACPPIDKEEIVNACGVDDFHDGSNVIRTACIVSMSKARDVFEPIITQLGYRLAHVLRRMLPISMFLLNKDGQYLTGHEVFIKQIGAAYHDFIDTTERDVRNKCLEDLVSTTRYITWSLHTRNGFGLKHMLRDALTVSGGDENHPVSVSAAAAAPKNGSVANGGSLITHPISDVLDSTLWNRDLSVVTEDIVSALVRQLFEGIRNYVVQAVEMKFNCFFLMPIVDVFPVKLREDVEAVFESNIDAVFDVSVARTSLEQKKIDLEHEKRQLEKLQKKFSSVHATLASNGGLEGALQM